MLSKVKPIKPIIIAENWDNGPKNGVKFTPIQELTKSTIANPINNIPNNSTNLEPWEISFVLTSLFVTTLIKPRVNLTCGIPWLFLSVLNGV